MTDVRSPRTIDGSHRVDVPRHAGPARWPLVATDVAAWVVGPALVLTVVARADAGVIAPAAVTIAVALAIAAHLGVGHLWSRGRASRLSGSYDDVVAVTAAVGAGGLVLLILGVVLEGMPTGFVVAVPITLVLATAGRLVMHHRELLLLRPSPATAERTVVVGAGEGGEELVRLMMRSPASPWLPVAFIDDDPGKSRLRLHGVPVRGRREDLATVAAAARATTVVIAVARADRALVADVLDHATSLGLDVKVLPPPCEVLTRPLEMSDVRPLTPADLLGRDEAVLDVGAISSYLTGRRVLVTGAGGSIGSELCRQVAGFFPSRLVMLDRDESALHALQLSLSGRAMLDERDVVVADIRDRDRLDAVFSEHHPEVVFHAAALKHLPLLEMHPGEGLQTNVGGSLNVLAACSAWGVDRMVNVSTDKAADPSSVLGYTKRIAERLTAWWAVPGELTALSVRFGNVLGSRGSVLTTFGEQIRCGGPVTVTDPEVTRYFMTVEEAAGLVVQAGAIGRPGEVLVLDMGAPVLILDVVRRLMTQAGVDLDVQYTGLRPGEKLHEDLFGAGEVDERPMHPLISHVAVPRLDPRALEGLGAGVPEALLVRRLRDLCSAPACDSSSATSGATSGATSDVPAGEPADGPGPVDAAVHDLVHPVDRMSA